MSTFCRLCAELRDPSEIVTSIHDPDRLIEHKLTACCQWNPKSIEHKLPQDVCMFCLGKLENCWLFAQNVQLAQQKLLEVLGVKDVKETVPVQMPKPAKIKFECPNCLHVLPSRIALEKHKCDPNALAFICSFCDKRFKTNEGLQTHYKNLNKNKCDVCSQVFCNSQAFDLHRQEICGVLYDNELEGKPTFVDCNSVLSTSVIPERDSQANAEFALESGTVTALDIVPLQIQFEFDIKPSHPRNKRQRIANKNESNDFVCYLCDRGFKKFPLLRHHMAVHTLARKFKCEFCNLRFRTQRHYMFHQKVHVDYYCDMCQKKFPSAFALKVHKRMHVGASVKMYGCEECDHFFVDVSTYYNHMRRKHKLDRLAAKEKAKIIEPNGTTKPYVCEQCGKDFMDRSSLQAHASVHMDVRAFQCDVCSKTFKTKYNLKAHQETHTGEKSVQCPECGKTYSRKSVLLKHMGEHTGVFLKTFACDFCDRIFRSSYNMQNHRRTHTGEKPYRCNVCNHSTTTKSHLDRHMKTMAHLNKLNPIGLTTAHSMPHTSQMVTM